MANDKPHASGSEVQPFAVEFTAADAERYKPLLEDLEISDEQAFEFLSTMWSIMARFVEMGFSLEPCGQLLEDFEKAALSGHSGVNLRPPTQTTDSISSEDAPGDRR
ncbi:hypothetical protein [Prosthecomicrobium pneumaticum]|uniref:Uncharacterized protein n=1 Tax=Prosthecomicrobium pneumaticum TaxID=81895 RepID=A0A7W9FN85_9HYPH|nr:hypothetical protein [Prosthecomicrobium pneumaticum]MBB5753793.1 hypothetical protein [Prosthecomicrobium pneumaticum]